MKILAISGSIRSASFNTALLNCTSVLSPENINITLFNTIESIPVFNSETAEDNYPPIVKKLIDKIRQSDGVIISAPEYAHGISGALKNVLDWLVSSDALVLKPVMVASVSTSGLGGVRSYCSLVQVLTAMNCNVVIEASLCVPFAVVKFDDESNLIDELTEQRIKLALKAFEKMICTVNLN